MKKQLTFLCLAALIAGAAKSQTFINIPAGTSNTDPTYHNGSVSIGKTTAAVEKLDVEGNIGIPFGNYIGVNNSGITNRKFIQTGWDATNGDYLSFFTSGNVFEDQYEKFRIVSSGKFGIGTTTPKARLHVYEGTILGTNIGNFQILTSTGGRPDNTASGYNNMFNNVWLVRSEAGNDWWKAKFHDGISLDAANITPGTDTKTWWERHPYADRQSWGSANIPYMSLSQGRLGIGIYDAAARLDIQETNNSFSTFIARNSHTTGGGYCIQSNVKLDQTKALAVVNSSTGWVEPFVVLGNGQTRIGLQKPVTGTTHADAMLSVDGKIVSKSMYVTQQNWADFVFDKDYKLPKLSDIEAYYKANKHLPLIPSAEEVKENGIDVGEMNKLLLQKIEELTIIMVEQDKKMSEQDARIKELENKK